MVDDWSIPGLSNDEYRFLTQSQRTEYLDLKQQGESIIRSLTSIISIVVSLGFVQFLISDDINSAVWHISSEIANRCAPGALSYGSVRLHGVGVANSIIAIAISVLVVALVVEMWWCNRKLQSLQRLMPLHKEEVLVWSYDELFRKNQGQIDQAEGFLNSIKYRRSIAAGLALVGGGLFALVVLKQPKLLLVADLGIVVGGLVIIGKWLWEILSNSRLTIEEPFANPNHVSPVFLGLFIAAWLVSLWHLHPIFKLLNRFLIC